MSSHSAASFYLAGMLAMGAWIGVWLRPDLISCISFTTVLLVCVACALQGTLHRGFWALAGLAIAGIGMWSMAATLPENQPNHYLNHMHPEVQWLEIQILETLKPTPFSEKYTGEIRRVDTLITRGKVLVEMRKDSTQGFPGPRTAYPDAGASPAHTAPQNPGSFNYAQYLKTQGIYTRVKLTSSTCLVLPPSLISGQEPLFTLRRHLQNALEDLSLGRQETQIARALLLGDRMAIDPELRRAYTQAGILHILAISGLHVGILATFLFAVLSPLRHLRYGKGLQIAVGPYDPVGVCAYSRFQSFGRAGGIALQLCGPGCLS